MPAQPREISRPRKATATADTSGSSTENLLAAVKIVTGLSDKSCTEVVSGDLREGQEVVVGMQTDTVKTP